MADLIEIIEQVASEPASVSSDAGAVNQHSISELIEADKYLASRASATERTRRGLRFNKIVPPGAA